MLVNQLRDDAGVLHALDSAPIGRPVQIQVVGGIVSAEHRIARGTGFASVQIRNSRCPTALHRHDHGQVIRLELLFILFVYALHEHGILAVKVAGVGVVVRRVAAAVAIVARAAISTVAVAAVAGIVASTVAVATAGRILVANRLGKRILNSRQDALRRERRARHHIHRSRLFGDNLRDQSLGTREILGVVVLRHHVYLGNPPAADGHRNRDGALVALARAGVDAIHVAVRGRLRRVQRRMLLCGFRRDRRLTSGVGFGSGAAGRLVKRVLDGDQNALRGIRSARHRVHRRRLLGDHLGNKRLRVAKIRLVVVLRHDVDRRDLPAADGHGNRDGALVALPRPGVGAVLEVLRIHPVIGGVVAHARRRLVALPLGRHRDRLHLRSAGLLGYRIGGSVEHERLILRHHQGNHSTHQHRRHEETGRCRLLRNVAHLRGARAFGLRLFGVAHVLVFSHIRPKPHNHKTPHGEGAQAPPPHASRRRAHHSEPAFVIYHMRNLPAQIISYLKKPLS